MSRQDQIDYHVAINRRNGDPYVDRLLAPRRSCFFVPGLEHGISSNPKGFVNKIFLPLRQIHLGDRAPMAAGGG
jgi:hypothetical protein